MGGPVRRPKNEGRDAGLAGGGGGCVGLAGCASPDPKLYTLAAVDPAVAPAARALPAPVVELHRVDIPGYADRPEIVRSAADFRVHLASNERWSEPFGDLVQSVLTADLQRRLAGAVVYSDAGRGVGAGDPDRGGDDRADRVRRGGAGGAGGAVLGGGGG